MNQLADIEDALIEAGCPPEAMRAATLACVQVVEDQKSEQLMEFLLKWFERFPKTATGEAATGEATTGEAAKRVMLGPDFKLREAGRNAGVSHVAILKAQRRLEKWLPPIW